MAKTQEEMIAEFMARGGQVKKLETAEYKSSRELGKTAAERFFERKTQQPSGLKTVNPVTARRLAAQPKTQEDWERHYSRTPDTGLDDWEM